MLVLYVDDEPDLLEIGKIFLEQGGEFSVDTVTSAREALVSLGRKTYDAVISDYQMPEMNGTEFLKIVRTGGSLIPFIMLTGRSREEVVIEALNCGADFYLQKGGDTKVMFAELMHVIRKSVLMREAQTALAEQEQRFHDLQNANDLIQSVAPDGRFLYVNKKWLDILGYTVQDLPGLQIFDIIHKDSLDHCREMFTRVISGENVGIVDAVFQARDGRKVYVEGIANCKMTDGKPQYTRGIFKDITDRKRAEAALKESEARYRSVVEDQTEFISRILPDGTHVFVNDAYCRYFGRQREEIVGRKFALEIHDDDRTLVRNHLASLTREHPVATLTYRIAMPDGQIRWQQWSNRALFGEDGQVTEYQSVGRDITDLKETEEALVRRSEDLHAAYEELTASEEELRQNYDELSSKEQALRESEETFRAMVEQSSEGIIIVDFLGMLLFTNRRALEIIELPGGFDPAARINVLDFVAPEMRLNAIRDFMQVAAGTDSYLVNYRIITTNKNERWIECIGKKLTYKGASAMLLSLRDITGRMQDEGALRESEERYRTLYRDTPAMFFTLDSEGTVISVNGFGAGQLGYTVEELKGMPVLNIFYPEDRPAVAEQLKKCLQSTGQIFNWQFRKVKKDGSVIWVEEYVRAMNGPDGKTSILVVCDEITRRKKAELDLVRKNEELNAANEHLTTLEEELRANNDALVDSQRKAEESEERYRTLVDHAKEAIFVIQDERICFTNGNAEEISQYTPEELAAKPFLEFIHPDDRATLQDQHRRRLAGEKLEHNYIFRILAKNGAVRWMEINVSLITWEGRPAVLVFLSDVTERKRAEEALSQANRKLNLLYSITRHDILNQLTVLIGFLELSGSFIDDKARLAEFVQKELKAARTIRNQIAFTRDYQNMGLNAPAWQDVAASIRMASGALSLRNVKVQVDCEGLEVYADPLLEKVFYNLIDNAVKHGQEGLATIRISYQETDEGLIIVVEDNGTGIPPEIKKHLFERGVGKHTGLGLYLVREILSITGITIRESGEPGKGARFELVVPRGTYRLETAGQ
jgi:PAS domain S-box-containing protein